MSSRNILSLRPPDSEFVEVAFGRETRRHQQRVSNRLDIVIDGQPVRSWVRDWERPEWEHEIPTLDFVTQLSRSSPRKAKQQIDQLRGPRPGREPVTAELLYCPACFDISDGNLAVEISRTEDTLTWQRFGWIDEDDATTADALIPNASQFSFDASAYDHALNEAQAALSGNFLTDWRKRYRRRGPQQPGNY
ncbi:hypothetical protein [Arthrobacter sp. H20]|uniref:hypothetical protein n=1 Tax=Arthrobacter sp. H20 TaxID=1267981 RepID=UPI000478B7C3|nr:hypothetical protein [Arthrobacter sp. H20]